MIQIVAFEISKLCKTFNIDYVDLNTALSIYLKKKEGKGDVEENKKRVILWS